MGILDEVDARLRIRQGNKLGEDSAYLWKGSPPGQERKGGSGELWRRTKEKENFSQTINLRVGGRLDG